MTRIFCLLVILFFSKGLFSQDSLTVEQVVAYALRNNYNILLARYDSAIAAIDYDLRNGIFLPNINAGATYLVNNNNQKQKIRVIILLVSCMF